MTRIVVVAVASALYTGLPFVLPKTARELKIKKKKKKIEKALRVGIFSVAASATKCWPSQGSERYGVVGGRRGVGEVL